MGAGASAAMPETEEAALAAGNVYNAMDGCEVLGISADEMDAEWAKCKKAKKLVKFGGGFYCGLIEIDGKTPIYVFNGFFMSMRAKVIFEADALVHAAHAHATPPIGRIQLNTPQLP